MNEAISQLEEQWKNNRKCEGAEEKKKVICSHEEQVPSWTGNTRSDVTSKRKNHGNGQNGCSGLQNNTGSVIFSVLGRTDV